jgi:hypothetical protein
MRSPAPAMSGTGTCALIPSYEAEEELFLSVIHGAGNSDLGHSAAGVPGRPSVGGGLSWSRQR